MPCPKPLLAFLCLNTMVVCAQSSDTSSKYLLPFGEFEIGLGLNLAKYQQGTYGQSVLPMVFLGLGYGMPINSEVSTDVSIQPIGIYPLFKFFPIFSYQATLFGDLNFGMQATTHSRSKLGFYT